MLGTILEMLQWKAAHGVTDKGFEELLRIIKEHASRGKLTALYNI